MIMPSSARRDFLGRLAALGAAVGILPNRALAAPPAGHSRVEDPWIGRLKGTHRVVFHSHLPTEGLALRWAQTFLTTQRTVYGIAESDCSVVVGLNGRSIGWLFDESLWAKYPSIGDTMGVQGARNPMHGLITDLIARQVIILACANSIRASGGRFLPAPERGDDARVKAFADEAGASLMRGVEVVPSMVVTLQQAQDRGCRYVYAGG